MCETLFPRLEKRGIAGNTLSIVAGELLRLGCHATTVSFQGSTIDAVAQFAAAFLRRVLTQFAAVLDPETPETPLLTQFEAQLTASIRRVLAGASPETAGIALETLQASIELGILRTEGGNRGTGSRVASVERQLQLLLPEESAAPSVQAKNSMKERVLIALLARAIEQNRGENAALLPATARVVREFAVRNAGSLFPRWIARLRDALAGKSEEIRVVVPLSALLPEIPPNNGIIPMILALDKIRDSEPFPAVLTALANITRQARKSPREPWIRDFAAFALAFLPRNVETCDETAAACLTEVSELLREADLAGELGGCVEERGETVEAKKKRREIRDHRILGNFFQINIPAEKARELQEMEWRKWDQIVQSGQMETGETGETEKEDETPRNKSDEQAAENQRVISKETPKETPREETPSSTKRSLGVSSRRRASQGVSMSRVKPGRVIHSGFSDSEDAEDELNGQKSG